MNWLEISWNWGVKTVETMAIGWENEISPRFTRRNDGLAGVWCRRASRDENPTGRPSFRLKGEISPIIQNSMTQSKITKCYGNTL